MAIVMPYWWVQFVAAWWILFPAYAANILPPLAGGKTPIDFGRKWFDGRRIFGEHKTVGGFCLGIIGGTLVGLLEAYLQPQLNAFAAQWSVVLPGMSGASAVALPYMSGIAAIAIAAGAMLGDVGGSFIKRRLNLKPGAKAPLLDQLNFIIGAGLVAIWFIPITPLMFGFMLLLTPVIHRLVNIIGYRMKAKKVPW